MPKESDALSVINQVPLPDELWANRETDIKKLRSQVKIMARQLALLDEIDQHNREVNEKLRAALGLAASGDLELLVAQWLRTKDYVVTKLMPREPLPPSSPGRIYHKRS